MTGSQDLDQLCFHAHPLHQKLNYLSICQDFGRLPTLNYVLFMNYFISLSLSLVADHSDTYTEKASSTSSMESEIWRRLPPELLEHVLSLLPLKTFFNLRSTCKHFNSLLFTPSFISKYSSFPKNQTQVFSSFLLFSHPQFLLHQFPLYDSMLSQWRMLELPFLSLPSYSSGSGCSANLLSSSNGLLCFSLPNTASFLVCNLLTRSSRLVDFPTHPFHFTSVTLIPFSQGYKIFILSSGYSSDSAFVFDSKLDSWSQLSVLDAILDREGVFSNGYLYFTTPNPFSIVGFHFEKRMWERVIKEVPNDLAFARLVNDNDGEKLYMIGGIGSHGVSRSMKLWELREGERNWIEIVSVPEMMCRKFMSVCYHNYEHVYCFYHDGMICVCCSTWPEVLYFKISWQTWHWLPKCPSLPEKWSCGFKWFSFVPNLYASA